MTDGKELPWAAAAAMAATPSGPSTRRSCVACFPAIAASAAWMIAMVEGAKRQVTPNERALTILLISLTVVFLLAVGTLKGFSLYSERVSGSKSFSTLPALISLLVCLIGVSTCSALFCDSSRCNIPAGRCAARRVLQSACRKLHKSQGTSAGRNHNCWNRRSCRPHPAQTFSSRDMRDSVWARW